MARTSSASVAHVEKGEAEVSGVLLHGGDDFGAACIDDVDHLAAHHSGNIVIKDSDGGFGMAHGQMCGA